VSGWLPPRAQAQGSDVYHATCRFYGPLNDLLPASSRQRDLSWPWDTPEPVRELIEGLGVPHVEVGLILVNGEPAGWDHRLRDGDRVAVYPPLTHLAPEERAELQPGDPPLGRFVLDVHLGRLARWLRLLGLDTVYANWYDDAALAHISLREHRILLTRDRHLLMRSTVSYGHWVRAQDPRQQLLEVIEQYDLVPVLRPYTRCAHCNGALEPVPKAQIDNLLQPDTARVYQEFTRCSGCGQIYWPGSHLRRARTLLDSVREGLLDRAASAGQVDEAGR
jgi:uncharacterized protein with PIN domain